MRTLLSIAMVMGGIFALDSAANAGRKAKRSTQPPYYAVQPPQQLREQLLCEERAQNEDPSGKYAGYPCWAREMFGRGDSTGGQGR